MARMGSKRKIIILVWLLVVYSGWMVLVSQSGGLSEVLSRWPIALAMALGSYFAGSTPMGGGTVGFPVLTLMLGEAPELGRDFSFAIQSIGMVSASIFIFCLAHPVANRFLIWSIAGATIGTPIGVIWVSPMVPEFGIQIFFAILWAGFGVLHLWKLNEFASYNGFPQVAREKQMRYGLITGFIASLLIASILGVGVDLALYAVLVLVFRCDLRIAIPSSVILMAYTSVAGVATQAVTGKLNPEVYGYWLAATPVVVVGAPLGALVVKKLGRKPTLWVVSILCLIQLIWTLFRKFDLLGVLGVILSILSVGLFFLAFSWLYRLGESHPESS